MSIELDGLDQLMRTIEEAGKKLNKEVEAKALKAGGEVIADKLRPEIPVRSGNWRDHIIVSKVKNSQVDVGADQQGDAFYGYFNEFGTSKQKAKPVYGPVFNSSKDAAQEAMAQSIKEDLGL